MELLQGLLLVTTIHLLAAASPGPDFVLVTQQTLSHGKRIGLLVSLGITLGLSVHIIYSAFGLAALIANSSSALWVIKIRTLRRSVSSCRRSTRPEPVIRSIILVIVGWR